MIQQQALRFIVVGIFSTFINYIIFYIFYECFAVSYLFSSAIGFIAGLLAGYGLNKQWTFQAKATTQIYLIKYFLVYIISLVLSLLFLKFLVSILHVSPVVANIFAIGLTTCTNFIGTKLWVFKA